MFGCELVAIRQWLSAEAEKSPLLEAVTRKRLMETVTD
jgi:hypothetical protein